MDSRIARRRTSNAITQPRQGEATVEPNSKPCLLSFDHDFVRILDQLRYRERFEIPRSFGDLLPQDAGCGGLMNNVIAAPNINTAPDAVNEL